MLEKHFDYLLLVAFLAGIMVVSLLGAGSYYAYGATSLLSTFLISVPIVAAFSFLTFIIAKKNVSLKWKLVVPAIFLMISILGVVVYRMPCSGEGCLGSIIAAMVTPFIFYLFIVTIISFWIAVLSKERKYKYACMALAAGVITLAPPVYLSIVSTIDVVSCFAADPLRGKETWSGCYKLADQAFGSAEYCENVGFGDTRYSCYTRLATKQKDPEICKGIGPDMRYDSPTVKCLERVASRTNSPDICRAIDNPASRSRCLLLVAENMGRDELCAELTHPMGINLCYTNIAIGKEYDPDRKVRPELCERITTPDNPSKYTCYRRVARILKSPDICKKAERQRVSCMSEVALSLRRPAVCGELSTLFEKESCSYTVGLKRLSNKDFPDMCRRLTDPKARDECLRIVALRIDRPELCREIDDQEKKDGCLKWLAEK